MGLMKMALIGMGAAVAVGVAVPMISMVTSPFRTASGVIERTMNPDNVLRTYELFHDRWTGFEARIRQIQETQGHLINETNQAERSRLRVDMSAQRQSCREIAAAYNADATKTNRSIFQGREAPASLDMGRCG